MTRQFVIDLVLRGGLLPFGVAAIVFIALGRPWRKQSDLVARWAAAPALAFAAIATYLAFFGWPELAPAESWRYLAHTMLVALLLGLMDVTEIGPKAVRAVLRIVISVVAGWLFTPAFLDEQRVYWITALAAVIWLNWQFLPICMDRVNRATAMALIMAAAAAGSAITAQFGSFAKVGNLTGALAAGLGAAFLAALWQASVVQPRSIAVVIALLLPPAMASGDIFDDFLPPIVFWIPAAAPLLLGVSTLPPLRRRGGFVPNAVSSLVVLIALGAALLIALQNQPQDPYGY